MMKCVSVKIRRRPLIIEGIKVKESKEWLLLRHNPVDYVLDGYCFINSSFISKKTDISPDTFKFKVMSLKKDIGFDNILLDVNISDNYSLYSFLQEKKILVQIELESDEFAFIGFISKLNEKSFILKKVSVEGNLVNETNFQYNKVRNIYVKTDYLESLEKYIENFGSISVMDLE